MVSIEYKVNSIYSSLTGTHKIIILHYDIWGKMFVVRFTDVTILQTYWKGYRSLRWIKAFLCRLWSGVHIIYRSYTEAHKS